MKPWIHPQERRSRIYWWIQIPVVMVVMILGPILLLREPTPEHVLISALIVAVGAAALVIAIKVLRKLPEEYRYKAEDNEGQ